VNVPRRTLASAAALALAALIAAPVAPAAAQTAAPAGGFADARGIIVDLTVLTAVPLPGVLGNTPLDPNTFARSSQSCPPQVAEPAPDSLLNVAAPPAATANTVSTLAGARCDAPASVASAQTEGLAALFNAGVPVITADVIRAQANSDCTKAPNGEGSLFTNLVIAGQSIGPNPAPNTRIDIPGIATVIVNEQNPTADGRGIVVNGLHIIGASPLLRGDLIISHANSGVVCPNGKGSEIAEGLEAPDITFDKDATPSTARAGQTVTYNATVTNTSEEPCDVISFFDHLNPVFEFVSTPAASVTRRLREADDRGPPQERRAAGDVLQQPRDLLRAERQLRQRPAGAGHRARARAAGRAGSAGAAAHRCCSAARPGRAAAARRRPRCPPEVAPLVARGPDGAPFPREGAPSAYPDT